MMLISSTTKLEDLGTQLDHLIAEVRADPDFTNFVDLGVLGMKMLKAISTQFLHMFIDSSNWL